MKTKTRYHITLRSRNPKTGVIPVTTTSSDTCPDSCPLKQKKKCYGKLGPISWHWKEVDSGPRGISLSRLCAVIRTLPDGQLFRHNQIGDLPGVNERINKRDLRRLVDAARGKRGFTYTHKWVHPNNRKAIADSNRNGFTINLSSNNLVEADRLSRYNIGPVVTLLPITGPEVVYTPEGRKVVTCPAQTRKGVTCKTCKLCQRADRSVIVGFRVHGVMKKAVEAML